MANNYQDYVIKDGRLIGRFEEMYQNCDDPWNREKMGPICIEDSLVRRACEFTKLQEGHCCAIDLGCGVGAVVANISSVSDRLVGIDISETAISKAKTRLPQHDFRVGDTQDLIKRQGNLANLDYDAYNLIILCHVTWYILDDLKAFRAWLSEAWKGKYIVHILGTYEPGGQKYGTDFFSTHDEILKWWGLSFLEHGPLTQISDLHSANLSYFLAKVD